MLSQIVRITITETFKLYTITQPCFIFPLSPWGIRHYVFFQVI